MTTAPTDAGHQHFVSIERRDAIAIVRFANPPQGTISVRGARELLTAMEQLLGDDPARAIIITGGTPGIFIRHADIVTIARSARGLASGEIDPDAFTRNPFIDLLDRLDRAEKPVIAAIDGLCMGGGLEIALACTVRVAGAAATSIGLPEIRLDITPGAGGVPRLTRVIGPHRARLHALKGTLFDAAQAFAEGIVDEFADNALDRALEIAKEFAGRHPAALAAILRSSYTEASSADTARLFAEVISHDAVRVRLEQFLADGLRLDELD